MDPDDTRNAIETLRELLDAIDRGEVAAAPSQRAHVAGALDALQALDEQTGDHQ